MCAAPGPGHKSGSRLFASAPAPEPLRNFKCLRRMIYYLFPAAVLAMLAYMFWSVAFRLRRDRVMDLREIDRGRRIFSRRYRIRYLLGRSFKVSAEEPEWQPALVSRLRLAKPADAARREER